MAIDTHRGFNINVFRAAINELNIARPNLFLVEFSVPQGLTTAGQGMLTTVKTLEYWCEVAALPGVQIQTYPGQRYGYGNYETRALLNAFAELGVDIFFDTNAANWQFFADWMNLIINRNGQNGPLAQSGPNGASQNELEYRDNFVADVGVYIFDPMGNVIKHIIMRDAFPKAIGDIRLGWGELNSIMRLPVQFAYNDWYEAPVQNALPTVPALPPLK
jgi:hypothetical protein